MTSDSIRNHTFEKSLRGFKPAEVVSFLNKAADEIDRLNHIIAEQDQEMNKLKTKLEDFRAIETTIKKMLEEVDARTKEILQRANSESQKSREEIHLERQHILRNAREEAALITKEAEHKSKVFMANANTQLNRLHDQINLLHAQRLALVTRLKAILHSQVELLQSLQKDVVAPRLEPLQYSEVDVSKKGLNTEQLENIVKSLEKDEGIER